MALWAASRTWGGSGFVVVPTDASDGLLRAISAYDPDYAAGLTYTYGELWKLGLTQVPVDRTTGQPYDKSQLESVANDHGLIVSSDAVAAACSPFVTIHNDLSHRDVIGIGSSRRDGDLRPALDLPSVVDPGPDLSGDLALMVAMRSGMTCPPDTQLEATSDFEMAEVRDYIDFALHGKPTPRAPWPERGFAGPISDDAWTLTEHAVGWVGLERGPRTHLIVVGSTVDDFALAMTWDRMAGHSSATWLPLPVLEHAEGAGLVGNFITELALDLMQHAGSIRVTSCSLTPEAMQEALSAAVTQASAGVNVTGGGSLNITYSSGADLVFDATHQLAFVGNEEYDIRLTLPVKSGESGAVELVSPLPAHVPEAVRTAGQARPDWIVDVDLRPRAMPAGRGLRAQAMLVESNDWAQGAQVRSSAHGLSYRAHSQGWVSSRMSLRQSVAQPILRFPGLLDWVRDLVRTECKVAYSAAGRTAQICGQMWGGRETLLDDLPSIRPLLAEFARKCRSDAKDFPEHDGRAVSGLGAVLTFAGCQRALGLASETTRTRLDSLLECGVIRRGLVLRCATCSGRAFIAIDELAQRNVCSRCATMSPLVQARWEDPHDEPAWYYSLHGAVRDLMKDDGDIPLLGAAYLRKNAKQYIDESELEFTGGVKDCEIDLIAAADGELIVGEAKRNGRRSDGASALDKLVYVAKSIRADRIVLFNGADEPWNDAQITRLAKLRSKVSRPDGVVPRLISIVGLASQTPRVSEHS